MEGMTMAFIACSKNSITERPWRRQVWTTVNKLAVFLNRSIEREPPLTFRLVTAKRNVRSAMLLSGGISGWPKKYYHCSA